MYIDRKELKSRSKLLIGSSKPSIILVGLVVVAVLLLITLLSARLQISNSDWQRILNLLEEGKTSAAAKVYESAVPTFGETLVILALRIVSSIFSLGFIIFLLNSVRRADPVWGNLLDGFGVFWRYIGLAILESLFIFLWSLLLVVPGIIAAYRYRMAVYLLIDRPELSPLECIRESKRMMAGHKGELFVLDLSFIGWNLLCQIPIAGIAVMIWVVPYTETVYAMYYDVLSRVSKLEAQPWDALNRGTVDYIDGGNDTDGY